MKDIRCNSLLIYNATALTIVFFGFQVRASELIVDYSDGNKGKQGYSQQIFFYHLEDESLLENTTKTGTADKQLQKGEPQSIKQISHDISYQEYLGIHIYNNVLNYHSIKGKNSTVITFKPDVDQRITINNTVYICEAATDIKVMVMFRGGFDSTNNTTYSIPKNYNLPKFDLDKSTMIKNKTMNVKDLLMCEATRHGMTTLDSSKSIKEMITLIDDHVKNDWTARIAEAKKYKVNFNGQYFREDVDKMIADAKSDSKS